MNNYLIVSKEKYFILNNEKRYFSALNKIVISVELNRMKFVLYQENIVKKSYDTIEIPSALAQDLINMFHVRADFGGYAFVHREIK